VKGDVVFGGLMMISAEQWDAFFEYAPDAAAGSYCPNLSYLDPKTVQKMIDDIASCVVGFRLVTSEDAP
jgi:hypothetical protein